MTSVEVLGAARTAALTDLKMRAFVELFDAKALRVAELEARNAEQERAAMARIAELESAVSTSAVARAFAAAFAEALPGLYREHQRGGLNDDASAVNPDCSTGMGGPCDCAAAEHNATLNALADLLGIPAEERRRP